jgi:hypothetical protein
MWHPTAGSSSIGDVSAGRHHRRRRVLEAVDMDYWLIGDGGRDDEQRRPAQYPGDLG